MSNLLAIPTHARAALAAFATLVAMVVIHTGFGAASLGFGAAGVVLVCSSLIGLIASPWYPFAALGIFVLAAYGVFRYGNHFDDVLALHLPSWIALVGFAVWAAWLLRTRTVPRLTDGLTLALFAFVAWVGASIAAAWTRGDTLHYYVWHHPVQYLQGLALFLIAAHVLLERRDAWVFALLLCALPALQSLQRMSGGFYLDNDLPLLSAMLFPFAALGVARAPHWGLRLVFAALGLGMLRVVVLAQNRGAIVALVFAAVALWWNARHRLRWALATVPALILVLAMSPSKDYLQRFSVLWNPQASHRTAQLDRATVEGRLRLWDGALRMLADHPVLGVGAGSFSNATEEYMGRKTRLPTHNSVLNIAAETGLPGLLLYLVLFVGAVVMLQRSAARLRAHWAGPVACAVQAALVAYLAGGLFMSRQDMQLAYLLLGWAAALRYVGAEQERLPQAQRDAAHLLKG